MHDLRAELVHESCGDVLASVTVATWAQVGSALLGRVTEVRISPTPAQYDGEHVLLCRRESKPVPVDPDEIRRRVIAGWDLQRKHADDPRRVGTLHVPLTG